VKNKVCLALFIKGEETPNYVSKDTDGNSVIRASQLLYEAIGQAEEKNDQIVGCVSMHVVAGIPMSYILWDVENAFFDDEIIDHVHFPLRMHKLINDTYFMGL